MSGQRDDTLVKEIRDRNNIVQVVGDYVKLRKAGGRYTGLCPFHNERTPSFSVSESRQFFYCFGCQTGGDVISFVRELNGYSFPEALRHLADRCGVSLPDSMTRKGQSGGAPQDPTRERARRESRRRDRDAFFAVGRAAMRFYVDALGALEGKVCRAYIRERGLERETVERFGLGFAPDRWEGLAQELERQGFDQKMVEQLGLIMPRREGGTFYDRFRNRLMFPIRNLAGEVIAFGGRALPSPAPPGDDDGAKKPDTEKPNAKKPAKYINSPDTPVYDKGKTLFGLYEARQAMRNAGYGIVVEGNVDVLMVSQAGMRNVVAPMGTALTEEQCQLFKRFANRAVLFYDGDRAGRAAALKAIPSMMAQGVQVSVIALADGEDPDTFVKSGGADALKEAVDKARPGWEFLVTHTLTEARVAEDRLTGVPLAVDKLAPVLDMLPDRRVRSLCQADLAQRLGLDATTLSDFLRDVKRSGPRPPATPGAPSFNRPAAEGGIPRRPAALAGPPPPQRELHLLYVMLCEQEVRPLYHARDAGRWLTHAAVRAACEQLSDESLRAVSPAPPLSGEATELEPDDLFAVEFGGAGLVGAELTGPDDADALEPTPPTPQEFTLRLEDDGLRSWLLQRLMNPPPLSDYSAEFEQTARQLEREAARRSDPQVALTLTDDEEDLKRAFRQKKQRAQRYESLRKTSS